MTLWGATAAGALLFAVLTTRSDAGSQRIATIFSEPGTKQVAAHPFDPQEETHKLAESVRGLTIENGELESRVAAIEQNVNDITGSITKQIDEVKKEAANKWPADAKIEPITPEIVASITSPSVIPSPFGAPLPPPPPTRPAAQSPLPGDVTGSLPNPAEYGVDVGSALSVDVLRARWLGIRSAHRHLFEGLTPTVVLHQMPRTNRIELRLVVGPLENSEAAAQLCAALAVYRLVCQTVPFDGSHVALQ